MTPKYGQVFYSRKLRAAVVNVSLPGEPTELWPWVFASDSGTSCYPDEVVGYPEDCELMVRWSQFDRAMSRAEGFVRAMQDAIEAGEDLAAGSDKAYAAGWLAAANFIAARAQGK